MAVHFHPLIINQVIKETTDCVVIGFDIPTALKDVFNYVPGQNITVKTTIKGKEIRRSYSICSAPVENKLCIAVKKIDMGEFSGYANSGLQKGDMLEVLPPTGRFFTPLEPGNRKRYIAFASGSGITPVISIIKNTLVTEPESLFTLVYGNRSRSSIIFFEELEGLKNKFVQRFHFINILSREKTDTAINFGRINRDKLDELKKLIDYKSMDEAFICGPEAMIFCVKDFLEQHGLYKKKIHFELFTIPGQRTLPAPITDNITDRGPKSKIAIKLDGRSTDFELLLHGESILDAALKQGADLPFACKGGVCATCRAKLTEGEVSMDVNFALEQDEIDEGYILTCQAHPLTDRVSIDFDKR